MTIVINPGTGPVADATEDNARRGIVAFVADLVDMYGAASWDGILAGPHGGYWDAHVNVGGRTVTVSMPAATRR